MKVLRRTEAYASDDDNIVTERPHENEEVVELIYASVLEINLQLPAEQQLEKSRNTALFGEGGKLDSLSLANFIIILEEKLHERFGPGIDLTRDDPFSPTTGHFKTIGSLVTYISTLVSQ